MTIQLLEKQMSLLEYISDERVNPRLDSKYILQFSELAVFLEKLQDNEFVFSKNLLN